MLSPAEIQAKYLAILAQLPPVTYADDARSNAMAGMVVELLCDLHLKITKIAGE